MSKPNWQATRMALNAQRAIELLQEVERAYALAKPTDAEVKALAEIHLAVEHIQKGAALIEQQTH